jgi:uncharacterized protein (DUF2267 family)
MPLPTTYRHATRDWRAFVADAKEEQGLAFADRLPAVLRAIFVADWDLSRPPAPWADREALDAEARSLRPHHNLTPPGAIAAIARALRAHVRQMDFDRMLATLPPEARAFWHVEGAETITRKMT